MPELFGIAAKSDDFLTIRPGTHIAPVVVRGLPVSNAGRRILVVAQTTELARNLFGWLTDAGHELTVVTTFSAAMTHLLTLPDQLIHELKLREYNGLRLAMH